MLHWEGSAERASWRSLIVLGETWQFYDFDSEVSLRHPASVMLRWESPFDCCTVSLHFWRSSLTMGRLIWRLKHQFVIQKQTWRLKIKFDKCRRKWHVTSGNPNWWSLTGQRWPLEYGFDRWTPSMSAEEPTWLSDIQVDRCGCKWNIEVSFNDHLLVEMLHVRNTNLYLKSQSLLSKVLRNYWKARWMVDSPSWLLELGIECQRTLLPCQPKFHIDCWKANLTVEVQFNCWKDSLTVEIPMWLLKGKFDSRSSNQIHDS